MIDLYEEVKLLISAAPDLGDIERALVRERAIRKTMARSGEGREVVAETIDAMQGMDREMILDLTEGEPTTMIDALARYVRIVETYDEAITRDGVISDLGAILEHPWPAEEERLASHGVNQALDLHVKETGGSVSVTMGPNRWKVYEKDTYGNGAVADAVKDTAHAVYRAVLSRVIADRDHHVQLNEPMTRDLRAWLARPNGSTSAGPRLSLNAVAGGGVLIRTSPYAYQHRIAEARPDAVGALAPLVGLSLVRSAKGDEKARRYATERATPIDVETVRRALDNS